MKRFALLALLLLIPALLCGCNVAANTLENAQATAVPGLSMELHAASASQTNVYAMEMTLFFRYLNQPMLASETRTLSVQRDESSELALVRALLEGPSAGHVELQPLFPEAVEVMGVSARDNILFVTLSSALTSNEELPDDWQRRTEWAQEVPLLRRLAIQSLVATITENFSYTGVQIMVDSGSNQSSIRLDNSYFLSGQSGLSDPQIRDESVLLTPHNTARCILAAWHEHHYETLYAYTASISDGIARPVYSSFVEALDDCHSLSGFTLSSGSVSPNGSRAVITASLSLHQSGANSEVSAYPLALVRENGIWKISYSELHAMMLQ